MLLLVVGVAMNHQHTCGVAARKCVAEMRLVRACGRAGSYLLCNKNAHNSQSDP